LQWAAGIKEAYDRDMEEEDRAQIELDKEQHEDQALGALARKLGSDMQNITWNYTALRSSLNDLRAKHPPKSITLQQLKIHISSFS
jgi:hypothetical protein